MRVPRFKVSASEDRTVQLSFVDNDAPDIIYALVCTKINEQYCRSILNDNTLVAIERSVDSYLRMLIRTGKLVDDYFTGKFILGD